MLSWNLRQNALWHFDRHLAKLPVEAAQLASQVHHRLNSPFKADAEVYRDSRAVRFNPLVAWAAEHPNHYRFVVNCTSPQTIPTPAPQRRCDDEIWHFLKFFFIFQNIRRIGCCRRVSATCSGKQIACTQVNCHTRVFASARTALARHNWPRQTFAAQVCSLASTKCAWRCLDNKYSK